MKLTEKTISREDIFNGHIVHLHVDKAELENGRIATREVIDHPGGVCVAVLTEKQELLFVRQFRYPYQEVVLELPAGKLEPGEDPLEACKREQQEETGTTGRDYQKLGIYYPSPGFCNEVLHLYVCHAASFGSQNPDEDEFLEVEKIPLKQAVQMVMNGEIPDGKTQTLVLKVAHLVNTGKL